MTAAVGLRSGRISKILRSALVALKDLPSKTSQKVTDAYPGVLWVVDI